MLGPLSTDASRVISIRSSLMLLRMLHSLKVKEKQRTQDRYILLWELKGATDRELEIIDISSCVCKKEVKEDILTTLTCSTEMTRAL